MTSFWKHLFNRLPGWPNERQWTALITFSMGFYMLRMAAANSELWTVELFKTLITVVIVTGCVNMILSFHFSANKSDEDRVALDVKRAETTNTAFEAIKAATGTTGLQDGDQVILEKKND